MPDKLHTVAMHSLNNIIDSDREESVALVSHPCAKFSELGQMYADVSNVINHSTIGPF